MTKTSNRNGGAARRRRPRSRSPLRADEAMGSGGHMAKTKCSTRIGWLSSGGFTPPKPCSRVATVIQTHTVAPFVSPAGKDFNRAGGTYANAYCDGHKHSDADVVRFGMTVEKL